MIALFMAFHIERNEYFLQNVLISKWAIKYYIYNAVYFVIIVKVLLMCFKYF